MDTTKAREQLGKLNTWRQQILGLGIVPPDVSDLLAIVEDANGSVRKLIEEKARLAKEVADLDSTFVSARNKGEESIKTAHRDLKLSLENELENLRFNRNVERVNHKEFLDEADKVSKELSTQIEAKVKQLKDVTDEFNKVSVAFTTFKKEHGL